MSFQYASDFASPQAMTRRCQKGRDIVARFNRYLLIYLSLSGHFDHGMEISKVLRPSQRRNQPGVGNGDCLTRLNPTMISINGLGGVKLNINQLPAVKPVKEQPPNPLFLMLMYSPKARLCGKESLNRIPMEGRCGSTLSWYLSLPRSFHLIGDDV